MYTSVDFRKRVLAYEGDHRIVDTADLFGISVRVISSWKRPEGIYRRDPSPYKERIHRENSDK
jgi:hypothetical protein